jgi:hypothetical protein
MDASRTDSWIGIAGPEKAAPYTLPSDATKSLLFALICYLVGISLLLSAAIVVICVY